MSATAEQLEQLQDDLDKGSILGEEAEAAQKQLDEGKAAAEAAEAEKKAEEEKLALEKMTDEEKAAVEAKAAEEAKVAEEKAAKEAYEKLSDEEKAEHDKKVEEERDAAKQAERDERNKNIKIPKFRLDAATARARKAEDERDKLVEKLAEAEAEKAKANEDALTDAQKHDKSLAGFDTKIAEAMKDGDSEAVAKLMAESRTAEREFQSAQAATNLQNSSEATRAQVDESTLVNSILDQLEEQFPMFDENSDQYNAEANADVLKMQRGLIAGGDSAADALVEAVNMVLPKYGVTMEEEDSTSEKEAEVAKKAAAEKAKQVKKNLEDAGKIPPDMDNAGEDSDSAGANSDLPNAADLTDEEYDALPESKKKEMRGDKF